MKKIPIKAARVAAGLTQKEMAEKMGVERQSIQKWENGERVMKIPYFKLFCRITGFEEDDLILPTKTTLSGEQEET